MRVFSKLIKPRFLCHISILTLILILGHQVITQNTIFAWDIHILITWPLLPRLLKRNGISNGMNRGYQGNHNSPEAWSSLATIRIISVTLGTFYITKKFWVRNFNWKISSFRALRVLIVDWDIHHGNGTQHTFQSDPK